MSERLPFIDIAVIGGGAAGFFFAANIDPSYKTVIFEKSSKVLSKVRISGGGRCNVTNAEREIPFLLKNYPRGNKELRGPFHTFATADTWNWFSERNVKLKAEKDGRVFPVSDSSEDIARCLMDEINKRSVKVELNKVLQNIHKEGEFFKLSFADSELNCKYIFLAVGGNPSLKFYDLIKEIGHTITPPVPSLFTFNIPNNNITSLMGLSVPDATVEIRNLKVKRTGPLLITHWGFSGPAILKLSAEAARSLADLNYDFNISVRWISPDLDPEEIIANEIRYSGSRIISSRALFALPSRLWSYLCEKTSVSGKWSELNSLSRKKLISSLINDVYYIKGKTTFKEEFVTSGGVSLKEINFKTLESRIVPGVFFGGEILDIDALTGGFNFQAAWTTSYLAASELNQRKKIAGI